MDTYFLKNEDIFKFYDHINQKYDLFVPLKLKTTLKVKCDYGFDLPSEDYYLKKYSQADKAEIVFNDYRPIEPARTFFTHFKEEICAYFADDKEKSLKERPIAVFGLKNCDLFSLKIQDFVFLGGSEPDPVYKERRENALIIASDCLHFKEACFCRAFDINPHPTEGFDFNLSPLNNGYVVEVASSKAKVIAAALKDIFTPATLGQLSGRSAKRESVIRRLDEHLDAHKIPKKEILKDIVVSGYNSPVWQEQMHTCVECAGCVLMCDTCHCFLLADEALAENARRLRLWDGCLFKNFTKVAGGANPLKMRYMRLRNRYLKKFNFFIDNMGIQACCGCGRCIDVCPGKIDIRYILRRLYEEKYLPAA
ncbi:MAG: 4Fe-4S dicluster domain-containing protein [Candidatus Omnitrophica bacterium]|nr:4Fe-4S dicluster domain-containing protein [Candidatus Omnitrophota bacterium]